MTQLTSAYIDKIKEALVESCFTINDFSINFPTSGQTYICITFEHRSEFKFYVTEETRTESIQINNEYNMGNRIEKRVSSDLIAYVIPGKYKIKDKVDLYDFQGAIDLIPSWCKQIKAELYASSPKHDPMAAIRAEFESQLREQFESTIDDPDAFFSEDEN